MKVILRSTDVIHDFAVPQFRIKMDAVPGMATYQWFTPTATGSYEVLCEELCGLAHFAMRGKIVVEEQADFQTWLEGRPTFAETRARPQGDASAGRATYAVCAACHGQQAEGNPELNAPRLADLSAWYMRRQIRNYQQGIRGSDPRDVFGLQMAPMARVLADEAALENLIAYLDTVDAPPAPSTVIGDAERGRELYSTCAACHGRNGEGSWSTNAPRLAGMDDWYLVRQLQNFKDRIRGGHAEDVYGDQMYMLSGMLADEEAINDVVAYIDTLP